jgi:hypothetical protein
MSTKFSNTKTAVAAPAAIVCYDGKKLRGRALTQCGQTDYDFEM